MDEEEIIKILWSYLADTLPGGRRKFPSDPFSDDASWFRVGSRSQLIFFKSDMFVSSTDAPKGMTPVQMAEKAITGCVSDFAAKGIGPRYGLISIAIPSEFATFEAISDLGRGFRNAANAYGLSIIGGDTNESRASELIIDVSLTGFGHSIIKRVGAKPGDLIGVSGGFGLQPIGLRLLSDRGMYSVGKNVRRRAIQSVLEPKARLEFGLSIRKYLSSSIDSSDGLAISLYHLAESGRVDLRLENLPTASGVIDFALQNSLESTNLVLFGGEEYELVFTFNRKYLWQIEKLGGIVIGRVLSPAKGKPTVYFQNEIIDRKGWLHLQSH